MASVSTLVTSVIGVKLAATGAPTALPGEACGHLHADTGTTKDPGNKKGQRVK